MRNILVPSSTPWYRNGKAIQFRNSLSTPYENPSGLGKTGQRKGKTLS